MSISDKQIAQLEKLLKSQYDGVNPLKKRGRSEPEDVVKFFHDMTEEDRREIAPQVKSWRKVAMDWQSDFELRRVWLALHATATFSELNKLGNWFADNLACEVMANRQVSWLQEWSEQALGHMGGGYFIGDLVSGLTKLEEQGLISPPVHDLYPIGIAYYYLKFWGDDDAGTALTNQLRADLPMWGENFWRQFEVEGGGEVSLANFDKYMAPKLRTSWSQTLVALSDDGSLDRNRLLDASLDALNRGFKQFCANWFSQFHEELNPSPEERAARQDRYCTLLASPIAPTVSMAIAALKGIQKAGHLDHKLLLSQIEPALFAKAAKTAKGALSLLANVAVAMPDARSEVLIAAAASLEHPKTDVQQAGLILLEKYSDAIDDTVGDAIDLRQSVVSAILRSRLEALTGNAPPPAAKSQPSDGADLTALKKQADKVSRELQKLAGINSALDVMNDAVADIPRALFTGMDVPRLDPSKAITPIETFAEFIDEALIAVEHPCDFERFERVLAGAVKFADDRPDNEAELLTPLARSLKRFSIEISQGTGWAAACSILQIVLAPFVGIKTGECFVFDTNPLAAIVLRAKAVAEAVTNKQKRQQFSAPTHQGFWIDPLVLVERTRYAADNAVQPLTLADQSLALLRLAPDNRAKALLKAKDLKGEWASALRFALGGNEKIGETLSLWAAAVRARDPFGDDENISRLSGQQRYGEQLAPALTFKITWDLDRENGPDCTLKISSGAKDDEGLDFGKECWRPFFGEKEPTQQADPARCVPTVGLSAPEGLRELDIYQGWDSNDAPASWIMCLWPQHPEPLFTLSAKAGCMLDGVVGYEPATEPLADGLTLIHDPDVPVGPMGVLMLCRGLNTLDKAAAQATVDAWIAVIEDGRMDGETLGATMHDLLMGGIIVAKRWSSLLRDIARVSPLHASAIRQALVRAIYPGTPQRPLRNMHAWLEVLHELCVETDAAIEDSEAREGLTAHFTSGQAKKLAKTLLDLKASGNVAHRTAAAAYAFEQRIARAERWQSWLA